MQTENELVKLETGVERVALISKEIERERVHPK